MKKIIIHFLSHIEKYRLIAIGILSLFWVLFPDNNKLEPLIAFIVVIFAVFALKKIVIKGNVDIELMKIISRSNPVEDWHTNEQFNEKEHIAVYRKDPKLLIVRYTDPLNDSFRESWLNYLYPDPSAQSFQLSIRYEGNELINRTVLLVDGGRVFIPLPKSPKELTTTEFDLALCQILNHTTLYDTAYYFKQSKIKITKDVIAK